jgi:glycosyltransferase involved in cell wall biosynthesis
MLQAHLSNLRKSVRRARQGVFTLTHGVRRPTFANGSAPFEMDTHRDQSNKRFPAIAFLPWGNVIEDFLDTIGVSIDAFCKDFTGSYMFRYIEALNQVGVRVVLICMTTRVIKPVRFTHEPTGAAIYMLPAPWSYQFLRRKMLRPYGPYARSVQQAFGEIKGVRVLLLPILVLLKELALYLTTSPMLLARVVRREQCSAILCQEYEYPRFDVCVLLARLMRVPVFGVFQGGDYQRSRLERFLRPLSLRSCTGLIIGTQTEIQRVQDRYGVPTAKLARIFNPIDPRLWQPMDRREARIATGIPLDAKVVVWHGRVSIPPKGLDLLLDAWEQLCRERPTQNLRLLLIGTGQDAQKLHQRIAVMEKRTVSWINEFVHDRFAVRRYLSAADIYVFPSRHEGFPVAPLEAMGCGLPIVATDVQGIPDILEGGEASGGLMVPRDNVAELTRALGRLLDDETWRRELGKRARQRIEARFSLEEVGRQLRAFLLDDERAKAGRDVSSRRPRRYDD